MSTPPDPSLQFDRVEQAEEAAQPSLCSQCSQQIISVYYESGGQLLCERCKFAREAPVEGSGAGRFSRAILAGSAAAIAGSLLYYAISELTGYQFGLIAIVVGYAVGKAVRWGSRNRGGWRYQTIAVALTYLSIVATYVPYIFEAAKNMEPEATATAPATTTAAPPAKSAAAPPKAVEANAVTTVSGGELAVAALIFAAIILASPFLAGLENFIGLLIIFFGLFEAWKINKKVVEVVNGPFRLAEK